MYAILALVLMVITIEIPIIDSYTLRLITGSIRTLRALSSYIINQY